MLLRVIDQQYVEIARRETEYRNLVVRSYEVVTAVGRNILSWV